MRWKRGMNQGHKIPNSNSVDLLLVISWAFLQFHPTGARRQIKCWHLLHTHSQLGYMKATASAWKTMVSIFFISRNTQISSTTNCLCLKQLLNFVGLNAIFVYFLLRHLETYVIWLPVNKMGLFHHHLYGHSSKYFLDYSYSRSIICGT